MTAVPREIAHAFERRVRDEAGIMFQLHQHQDIRKSAAADCRTLDHAGDCNRRRQEQSSQMQTEFLQHARVAVASKQWISSVRSQHKEVIERAIELVLAHVAPMRRRAS